MLNKWLEDNAFWIYMTFAFKGPSVDHTSGTADGWYMYLGKLLKELTLWSKIIILENNRHFSTTIAWWKR